MKRSNPKQTVCVRFAVPLNLIICCDILGCHNCYQSFTPLRRDISPYFFAELFKFSHVGGFASMKLFQVTSGDLNQIQIWTVTRPSSFYFILFFLNYSKVAMLFYFQSLFNLNVPELKLNIVKRRHYSSSRISGRQQDSWSHWLRWVMKVIRQSAEYFPKSLAEHQHSLGKCETSVYGIFGHQCLLPWNWIQLGPVSV